MAIRCSYCGEPLHKDDARFCQNCGTLVSSHPFSPRFADGARQGSPSSSVPSENASLKVREQLARQPSSHGIKDEPPSWMGKLGRNGPDNSTAQTQNSSENESAHDRQSITETPTQLVPADLPQSEEESARDRQSIAETPTLLVPADLSQSEQESAHDMRSITETPTQLVPADLSQKTPGVVEGSQKPEATIAWPEPITHVYPSATPSSPDNEAASNLAQEDFPPLPSFSSPQELHMKVWDAPEVNADTAPEEEKTVPTAIEAPATEQAKADEQEERREPAEPAATGEQRESTQSEATNAHDIDILPTQSLSAVSATQASTGEDMDADLLPTRPLESVPVEQSQVDAQPSPTDDSDHVEHLDTIPLLAHAPVPAPAALSPDNGTARGNTPLPPVTERERSQPGFAPVEQLQPQVREAAHVPSSALHASQQRPGTNANVLSPSRDRKRTFSLVIAVVVAVLVIGAVGSWIALDQPFSVAPGTNPMQAFQNSDMGLSVSYPSGWSVQVNKEKSIVRFSDSSQTDLVTIHIISATSTGVSQYLQQQASQLGMTGAKQGAPLSFAGDTWQQMRGNVQISGATYTETLLATQRGSHFYTLAQSAPQVTYDAEETVTFAPVRASFQFLS